MTTQNQLTTTVLFVIYGAVFAGRGLLTKHPDEPLNLPMAIKTLVIGIVAGLLASTQADAPNQAAIDSALAVAVPLVDTLYNQFIPPRFGGSHLSGVGKTMDTRVTGSP